MRFERRDGRRSRAAILEYLGKCELPATQQEIAAAVGLGRATVREHLIALRGAGLILWDTPRARTIRLAPVEEGAA